MTLAIEPVLDHYGVEYDPGKGGNQQVKCPFHDDTHASASVNLDKGLFNCYGCATSGDGIELLMDQEGLEFIAAKRLAEELAGSDSREISRESGRDNSLLPRRPGTRPGRRNWSPPWARGRTGPRP